MYIFVIFLEGKCIILEHYTGPFTNITLKKRKITNKF
jgi:hypothetical protein